MTTHELQMNNAEISKTASAILVYDPLVISSPFIFLQVTRPESGHICTP